MVFPNVLTKALPARASAAFFACVACLLASAAAAHATAGETIGYTAPAGHSAATRGGTSSFQGNNGEFEDVVVQFQDATQVVGSLDCSQSEPCDSYNIYPHEDAHEVAVAPCQNFGSSSVYCPDAEYFVANLGSGANNRYELLAPLQYQSATVKAGNGGSKIYGTNPSAEEFEPALFPDHDYFTGGAGNDILVGGPGDDILRGGPGNDVLDGRGDEDQLYGEGGNDEITGGASGKSLEAGGEGTNKLGITFNLEAPDADSYDGGNETFDGEGGISTVSFYGAPGPVTAKVDGLPDSGVAGQHDTIEPNVTEVDGSEGNDTLIAGTGPIILDGEGGNDLIEGGPGGDTLRGGAGDNTIKTDGPDGAGPDSIYAAESYCNFEVSCPSGNSVIYAADGIQDQISCGPGADIVYADALDVVATTGVFACSTVYRSAGAGNPGGGAGNPGGGANPGGAGNAGASAGTSSFANVKTKGDVASLTFACAGATTATCADSLTLSALETLRAGRVVAVAAKTKKRSLTLGHASASLAGGASKTLSVSLDSAGRALLAHYRSLHVKLVATETIGGKQVVVKTLALTFTAPKRHR
ncbi:MAG TPA: calcium-binding protein [Solirubrobacteraceae bacterium]|jgi:Ca2+-binding RTX toxin-like protein|nr:calcium-binding protein [Solirubrobacteraceae bacterium]